MSIGRAAILARPVSRARLPVAEFRAQPGAAPLPEPQCRSDLRLLPLAFDEAHYRLYRRYQTARHAGGGMDQDDREQFRGFLLQSRVDSVLAEFSLDGEVVMVALVDKLIDGLSAVYTFFDPDLDKRSLGTFGVLSQIRLAREIGLPYVYLGYWIEAATKWLTNAATVRWKVGGWPLATIGVTTMANMAKLPDAVEQVLQMHAPFIHAVVNALNDRAQLPQLMQTLAAAEQQGWPELVRALRLDCRWQAR
jgi:hypothetical protein